MKTKLKWTKKHGQYTCALKLGKTIKVLERQLKDLRIQRDHGLASAAQDFSNIHAGDFDWDDDEESDVQTYAEGMAADLSRARYINYVICNINGAIENLKEAA